MPRAQRSLDFKVKKTSVTRTRSKRLANKENVVSVQEQVAIKDVENVPAPSKENQENVPALNSPKATRSRITSTLPLSPRNVNRIPPLGYQAINVSPCKTASGVAFSPSLKSIAASPLRSPINAIVSDEKTPTKRRALTFSPVRNGNVLPKSNCTEGVTKARALDFNPSHTNANEQSQKVTVTTDVPSPTKKSKLDETTLTPVRKTASQLLSPVNQSPRIQSPARRSVKFSSPTRQSPRNCLLLSPRLLDCPIKQDGTPKSPAPGKGTVKKLSFATEENKTSLVASSLLSPIKRSLISEEVRRSPRKHQSPMKGLQSPTKVMPSPRKLQLIGEEVRRSPRKHNTPLRLARQEGLCYQRAKRALNTALPKKLLCREKQYKEVNDFLDKCLDKNQPGSLYISGAPGTGKTAVLSHTLQRLKEEKENAVIYMNCMSVKNSQAIFNRVLGEIIGKESSLSTKEAAKQIEKNLSAKGDMIILIMDEVDQLDSKNQEVLYTMFEWPHLKNSRLVLIGIANALDLTDRILPRLQAKPKCKPKLMNFPPYSKDQIATIIKDRLSQVEVEGEQVLDANAIQFCARKVAAVAGDMRKALDVCRRAIEMVESEVKKQQVLAVTKSPSKQTAVRAVPKKISVAHIMRTVNEVYGSHASVQANSAQTVPLQQKLAICALLLSLKKGKSKEITLGKLHENYGKVCRKQEVPGVDQSEFMSLCTLIEARGIMGVKKAKETRLAKVSLKLDEGELERALQDKTLVSSVLQNGL